MTTQQPVGVDVGGTGIKIAPVDLARGELAGPRSRVLTPRPATPEAIVGTIVAQLAELDAPGPLGVALPSVVVDGIVRTAANIDAEWIGTDAAALLSGATGRAVGVVNDADAAGLAEVRFGAGRGERGLIVMVTLGTGIGTGLFFDGELVPNSELGHLPMHHGDAEHWAAESAREREDLSWEQWAHRLSRYFELLEQLLNPRLIIVGGGVSKRADRFVPLLECTTRVLPALLHNDAGIVGAAMFAPVAGG